MSLYLGTGTENIMVSIFNAKVNDSVSASEAVGTPYF